MRPEELQLGDIVATTPSGMPIKVVAIHRKKVAYHACTDRFSWVKIGLLQPIPLTDEILEKNGFGYKEEDGNLSHYYLGDRWYLANPDLHIGTYNKNVYWLNHWDNAIHGIKYVHELQHALRLCGINKKIEI